MLCSNGKNVPAPDRNVAFDLEGAGPQGVVRRAAMNALVTVRGHERESFAAIAPFVVSGTDRIQAMRALQRIPRRDWVRDEAPPLAESVLAYLASIPEADRRTPAAIEAVQLGESVAGAAAGYRGGASAERTGAVRRAGGAAGDTAAPDVVRSRTRSSFRRARRSSLFSRIPT